MVEVMTIRHNAWGYSRYILKDSLKYVPLYGLALWTVCGCVSAHMWFCDVLAWLYVCPEARPGGKQIVQVSDCNQWSHTHKLLLQWYAEFSKERDTGMECVNILCCKGLQ